MDDIKISMGGSSKKTDFEVTPLDASFGGRDGGREPSEKVKVRFSKFVQLVATHNFEDVMDRHAEEDIILSTNLLTDLANAHEEPPRENRKLPVLFIVGIVLGVVLTYFFIKF